MFRFLSFVGVLFVSLCSCLNLYDHIDTKDDDIKVQKNVSYISYDDNFIFFSKDDLMSLNFVSWFLKGASNDYPHLSISDEVNEVSSLAINGGYKIIKTTSDSYFDTSNVLYNCSKLTISKVIEEYHWIADIMQVVWTMHYTFTFGDSLQNYFSIDYYINTHQFVKDTSLPDIYTEIGLVGSDEYCYLTKVTFTNRLMGNLLLDNNDWSIYQQINTSNPFFYNYYLTSYQSYLENENGLIFNSGYREGHREGVQEGINQGYQSGYSDGYSAGQSSGYQSGYSDGYSEASDQDTTALAIFNGIVSIGLLPINVFLQIFNFEVFGINIGGMVSALLTICVVIIIIRLVTGKKE